MSYLRDKLSELKNLNIKTKFLDYKDFRVFLRGILSKNLLVLAVFTRTTLPLQISRGMRLQKVTTRKHDLGKILYS